MRLADRMQVLACTILYLVADFYVTTRELSELFQRFFFQVQRLRRKTAWTLGTFKSWPHKAEADSTAEPYLGDELHEANLVCLQDLDFVLDMFDINSKKYIPIIRFKVI